MGIPDAGKVMNKDACPIHAMGHTHGCSVWTGSHVSIEWSGGVRPGTLRNCPPEYLDPFAAHFWESAFLDPNTAIFMVQRALSTIASVLMTNRVHWPAAVGNLPEYVPMKGAKDDDAPKVLEMIFEQKYAPKAMCQLARRTELEAAFKSGRGGGAGGLLTDCVVREVMTALAAMGIRITWTPGGEFDGTGALRAAQGCRVIVPSRDGDMMVYPMGDFDCTGQVCSLHLCYS